MKYLRWSVTLAYAGVIFYLSSQPLGEMQLFPYADKLLHLIIYAGLGGLCAWSLGAARIGKWGRDMYLAALLATGYGILDEIHQAYVPGRHAEVLDVAADAAGALAGAALVVFLGRWLKAKAEA
jgi:VanZ family protein